MISCALSRQLWAAAAARLHLPAYEPGCWPVSFSLPDWLQFLSAAPASEKRARSLLLLVIWFIWRERNARIFRETDRSVQAVLDQISDEAANWVLAGARHLSIRE